MKTAQREAALIRLVEDYRDQECRRLLQEAESQARGLLHQAFRRERGNLHQRVVAERARAAGLIQAAKAERSTRERRRGEKGDAAMLDAAWPRLRACLLQRWADPTARRLWVGSHLDQALALLPAEEWVIRHADGWPAVEREQAVARVVGRGGARPQLQLDTDLQAGLIISAGGAGLDASIEGLLRDRARVEARLLALGRALGEVAARPAAAPVPVGADDVR